MNNTTINTIAEVHTAVAGGVGLITLNRPKALNALSLPMVQTLLATLQAWRDDPAVTAVAIRGSNKVGRPGTPVHCLVAFVPVAISAFSTRRRWLVMPR